MHIIHSPPSDLAVRDALIKEIKTGWEFNKQKERLDELRSEKEAAEIKTHKSINGLGRCVAVIPGDTFELLKKSYGHQEVHSNGFLKYWQKTYPNLSPNKI